MLKSEIGTKAAWKGFSSQTMYIASRLLHEKENLDFYPETIEDLMLKNGEDIVELVQIKNLKSDLTLSDLKPKSGDSFFKRVLKYKKDTLTPKIIVFGEIGEELKGALSHDKRYFQNIKSKLLEYDYTEEEIEWLLNNIVIEKVNESDLEKETLNKLKEKFSISSSINIFFSYLICYISKLSRNGEKTNKDIWNENVNRIIEGIVSIDSIYKQYGRTLFSLSSFTTNKDVEQQREEFKNGFDAKPYYIRNNLDIYRKKWMDKIEECYKRDNIVIIRGLSGQGKSTLAYRFLLDNYNENSIFIVKNLCDLNEAKDIISVIEGLTINDYSESIIYMDITPYDKSWKIILDHLRDRDTKVKILITIREEDYKRNNLNSNLYDYSEIELLLEKDEAEEIYSIYDSKYFLNFDDAWKKFGENGPFMEFMYFLSKNEKLIDKLEKQIDNIIENEEDSDDWLKFLLIVSLAGKDNFSISFEKISQIIESKNFTKILKNAQKEYLIKIDDDLRYIKATHALRANILAELIYSKIVVDKEVTIINTLECTREFYPSLIVEYLKDGRINVEELIKKITMFENLEWSSYASFIRAMLWYDTYNIYIRNLKTIKQYNALANNNFILLFVVDITNIIDFDREEQINLLEELNPELTKTIKENVNFDDFVLDYIYTDLLFENIFTKITNKNIEKKDNYSYVGYTLFWLGNRKKIVEQIVINEIDYSKNLELEDLLIGLKVQNLIKEYKQILEKLIKKQITKNNVIEISENDEISVKFINNIMDDEKTNHEKVMKVVHSLKRTFYGKRRYNVKMIGEKLIDEIEVCDVEKRIENGRIPLSWAVDINSQFLNMDNYNNTVETWYEYKEYLDKECDILFRYISKLNSALDYFYRKGNAKKLIDSEFFALINELNNNLMNINSVPKCAMNEYSIENSLYSFRNDRKLNGIENQNTLIVNNLTKFINKFNDYFMIKDKAILSKINNLKEKNEINSLFSLIEGVKDYITFMKEYSKQFEENEVLIKLYDELKVLVLFWSNFITQPFICSKSKLYEIKERKKEKDNKFIKFIEDNVYKYRFEDNGEVYYKVDIGKFDSFCENLYDKYSKYGGLSYEMILFTEFDTNNILNIIYTLDGKNIRVGVRMKLSSVLNYKSYEEFVTKSIIPENYTGIIFESIADIEDNNILYNYFISKCELQSLKIYFNHILSVNENITDVSDECIEVYNGWKDTISNLLKEEINEIKRRCMIICEQVTMLDVKERFNIFLDALEQLKDLSEDIVKVKEENNFPEIKLFEDSLTAIVSEIEANTNI